MELKKRVLLSISAYRALRCSEFVLRVDPQAPSKYESLMKEAALDLIQSYLEISPSFPEKPVPPYRKRKLSNSQESADTGSSLVSYLYALPERAVVPVPPSLSTYKDSAFHQTVRDVERDSFCINGTTMKGSEVHFEGVLSSCEKEARACLSSLHVPSSSESLVKVSAFCTEVLRRANRTASGGDSFEAVLQVMGLDGGSRSLPLELLADSKNALPVEMNFSQGVICYVAGSPCGSEETGASRGSRPAPPTDLLTKILASSGSNVDPENLGKAFAWADNLAWGLCVKVRATTLYTLIKEGKDGEPHTVATVTASFVGRYAVDTATLELVPQGNPCVQISIEPL